MSDEERIKPTITFYDPTIPTTEEHCLNWEKEREKYQLRYEASVAITEAALLELARKYYDKKYE